MANGTVIVRLALSTSASAPLDGEILRIRPDPSPPDLFGVGLPVADEGVLGLGDVFRPGEALGLGGVLRPGDVLRRGDTVGVALGAGLPVVCAEGPAGLAAVSGTRGRYS